MKRLDGNARWLHTLALGCAAFLLGSCAEMSQVLESGGSSRSKCSQLQVACDSSGSAVSWIAWKSS